MTPGCPDGIERGNWECGTTNFIQEVKDHGLKVHAFTFRNEWMKLYWDHGQDPYRHTKYFLGPKSLFVETLFLANWRSFTS